MPSTIVRTRRDIDSGACVGARPLPRILVAVDETAIASLPCDPNAETLIGRAAHIAFHLAGDPYVSAYHAVIHWDDALHTHVIHDVDSCNGTYVDDVRVTGAIRLVDGARIRIGLTEVFYRSSGGSSSDYQPTRQPLVVS